jgi:hypothetical protein
LEAEGSGGNPIFPDSIFEVHTTGLRSVKFAKKKLSSKFARDIFSLKELTKIDVM